MIFFVKELCLELEEDSKVDDRVGAGDSLQWNLRKDRERNPYFLLYPLGGESAEGLEQGVANYIQTENLKFLFQ